jgi:hypothetical protein
MANKYKEFYTADDTSSYVSSPVNRDGNQNRTCVFQAKLSVGDTVVLEGRIAENMDFVEILTATDANVLQEVVTATQFRVTVTNTSGQRVTCAITN